MEYIEGPTLAGPIALAEALPINHAENQPDARRRLGLRRRTVPAASLCPDVGELQNKAPDRPLAQDALRVYDALRGASGPVNPYVSFLGVDEPAQLGAIGHVFFHLCLEPAEPFCGRAELDDEVGAQVEEAFLLLLGLRRNPILPNP